MFKLGRSTSPDSGKGKGPAYSVHEFQEVWFIFEDGVTCEDQLPHHLRTQRPNPKQNFSNRTQHYERKVMDHEQARLVLSL